MGRSWRGRRVSDQQRRAAFARMNPNSPYVKFSRRQRQEYMMRPHASTGLQLNNPEVELKEPPNIRYDAEQLGVGTKVEMEHTKDHDAAEIIAKHHLAESPDYYRALIPMEKNLETGKIGRDGKVHGATGTIIWDNQEGLPEDLKRFERITVNNPDDSEKWFEAESGGLHGWSKEQSEETRHDHIRESIKADGYLVTWNRLHALGNVTKDEETQRKAHADRDWMSEAYVEELHRARQLTRP